MLAPELLSAYNQVRKTSNTSIFCHAPFTSMNFAQNGHVTVCCYNRDFRLGVYPEQSLDEMWYGANAEAFRDLMAQNVLPKGCELCYEQLHSRNFGGLKAKFYDVLAEQGYRKKDGRFVTMPKVMEFEISNICNLECSMCNGFFSSSIRRNREHLPPLKSPYDAAFVDQLEPFIPHLQEARFLGGEPFLIKRYYDIWERMIQMNPSITVSITTNGTILTDRVKGILERLRANMILSIDALDRDTYERIRVNAKFEDVMAHLSYYRDYTRRKGTDLNFAVCPMRQNWQTLPTFLDYCNTQGIYLFFNTVVNPANATLRAMHYEELVAAVDYLEKAPLREESNVHRFNNANYLDLLRQIIDYRDHKSAYRHFKAESIRQQGWSLATQNGKEARLVFSPNDPAWLRIAIAHADTRVPWHIQLNQTPLSVTTAKRYTLCFQARADRPRQIELGVARADEPWDNLGLFMKMGLTTEWQELAVDFQPSADDHNARIHFDLGDSDIPVELSEIKLSSLPINEIATRFADRADVDESRWRLHLETGNAADLVFAQDTSERLQVTIEKAETKTPWGIQINKERLSVTSNQRYEVRFRARADRHRQMIVGVAQARAPWLGLGLYQTIALTPEWQPYELFFEATADEANARIHFDVGDSDIPVELSDVMLRRATASETLNRCQHVEVARS